ncbi:hypothetical protein BOX15_Mlig020746g1 [Macrostomum lignano]|uniref:Myotubularin phosphatase domain-containing protein n=3 Tax=Macrostomum lignano TaxID=282301 RepID=A0A267EEU8_9PLAT|nr:hypothetical protein BOX15_Mlig020746g1 [Macrostomum lignano]
MELQEHVLVTRVDNVSILKIGSPPQVSACLSLTSYFSVFFTSDGRQIEIRHDNLDGIDRSVSGCYTHLLLRCRTLSAYAVTIPGDKLGQDVYQSLRSLSDLLTSRRAVEQRLCFQFVFRLPGCANGWEKYNLNRPSSLPDTCDPTDWRLSLANAGQKLCPGYPDSLIVPARVSDSQLAESAKHRIGGRLPVLAYLHPASRRFLLVGAGVANDNKRCPADLAVLAAALDISCRLAGGQRLFGCLVDTRSAKAAKAEGGIEPPQHYNQWRARYLDLPPVGDLLTSLCRLVGSLAAESLDAGLPRQFKKSESSSGGGSGAGSASSGAPHWMDALQRTLDAANQLAGLLDGPAAREFACVFLHGRTGRDYSLLLAALVQVMLCPLARQFDGFLAVIDRAFVQFSHPFHRRCARSALYSLQPQQQQSSQQQQQQQQQLLQQQQLAESAPVFLLFLDCCRCLCRQYPAAFEFSEDLLISLAENAYCSNYGTFLFDDCASRARLQAAESTVSLWSHFDQPSIRSNLINPLYNLRRPVSQAVLLADTRPAELTPWTELYLGAVCCPLAEAPPPRERLAARLADSLQRERELEERLAGLKRQQLSDNSTDGCAA